MDPILPLTSEEILLRAIVQRLDRRAQTEEIALDAVLSRIDQLPDDKREEVLKGLKFWDWHLVDNQLTEQNRERGLPPPSEEDILTELKARRTQDTLDGLGSEITRILRCLEIDDADHVFEELLQSASTSYINRRAQLLNLIAKQAAACVRWRELWSELMDMNEITPEQVEDETKPETT